MKSSLCSYFETKLEIYRANRVLSCKLGFIVSKLEKTNISTTVIACLLESYVVLIVSCHVNWVLSCLIRENQHSYLCYDV